jgi:hypothetical protein
MQVTLPPDLEQRVADRVAGGASITGEELFAGIERILEARRHPV